MRRAASAGAVVLLHVLLLAAFLFANFARNHLQSGSREIELAFPPAVRRAMPPRAPALQPNLIAPAMPEIVTPPVLPPGTPGTLPAAPAPGGILGVGRALFGCDPEKLDTLPSGARASCLRLYAGKPHEQSARLGPPPDPNSPFTKEIEERFREAQPIIRPCAQGSHNDTLGLPCFDFEQKSPLLPGR